MANEVSFLIKIYSDGGAKKVTADAEEMGRVIREVQDEAEKAKRDVLTWAQAAQAVDVLQSSISELQAALTEMTADYQTSVVAQTQLATIMRQRMGSTEEVYKPSGTCAPPSRNSAWWRTTSQRAAPSRDFFIMYC